MKQSAVEFLQECLSIHLSHQQQMQFEGLFQQAKEMEKEQTIDFAKTCLNKAKDLDVLTSFLNVDKYYNENFNS
jgi:hypothetical protein